MAELLSSKVIITEEEPKVRGIPSLSTSVAGAIGITERGPIGKAVLCNSFDEFEQRFGGFTSQSDLALAAMGFFENGGSQLWVVRTVHYDDVFDPATADRASAHLIHTSDVPETPENEDPQPPPTTTDVILVEGKDEGVYAERIEVKVNAPISGDAGFFDVVIIEDGVYRESFTNLSMDADHERYIETAINHELLGSHLIRVTDQKEEGHPIPDIQTIQLVGGDDGLTALDDNDFVGSDAGKTGLYAFDHVQDLSLLLIPGRATSAVHQAIISYCEISRQGMVFSILDPPANQSATDIVDYVQNTASLLTLSEYGAIYWPRLKVLNPSKSVYGLTDTVTVPPSGIVAGVFARTDAARPGGVYDPPAGIDKGRMFGVLGFETDEVLDENKRDLIYPKRINPLTTGPGLPRFIDGSRTLKGDGNFPYIAERRGVIFIERSLKQSLQFARHKNNTESLRAEVRRTINAFLLAQMNNGAFRSKDPSQAFFVDVSDALNPPSAIFAGKLLARIGLATNKPAEFIILSISQNTKAFDIELASLTA